MTAVVPAFPGCVSQGRTQDEALANIQSAMSGWLDEWLSARRATVPKQSAKDILRATREAIEIQKAIHSEDGEQIDFAFELRTVTVPMTQAA